MTTNFFSIVCKDISTQDAFVFPDQILTFQDDDKQIINITCSITNNKFLSAFLHNSILFVSTKLNEQNIGFFPSSESFQEVFISSKKIKGIEISQIEITYQRLSVSDNETSLSSPTNQKYKMSSKKYFKEQQLIDDENYQQSPKLTKNKKFKTEMLNKIFKDDFLSDFDEEELTLKLQNSSTISNSQAFQTKIEDISTTQQNNQPSKKNNRLFQQKKDELNEVIKNSSSPIDYANMPRSKERTILSAIIIVSKWRDLYNISKLNRVHHDLQHIAEEMGLSKKVLDYYFLELRTAEFFNYDFNANLSQKFGKIRQFNNTSKLQYIKNNNCKKIPISNKLNYRLSSTMLCNNNKNNKQ